MMSNPYDPRHPNNFKKNEHHADDLSKHVSAVTLSLLEKPFKTLYNPSKDIKCLANQVKSHFSELELFSLVVDKEEVKDNEFAILWISQSNPGAEEMPIMISDNDQLEEIYLMHSIKKDKLPHFRIKVDREYVEYVTALRTK